MADAANPFAKYVTAAPAAPAGAPQAGNGAAPDVNPFAKYVGGGGDDKPAQPEYKGGTIESFLRGVTNGATFNLADPIAAAANAALPAVGDALDPVKPSHAATFGERYHENLASLHQGLQTDQAEHPVASVAGEIAGGFANPVTRALPVAQSFGGAALQGATIGAGYGAGDAISKQEDTLNSVVDTALGGFFGAAGNVALHGLGRTLAPAEKTGAADLLNKEGVPTTIGQSLGGTAQRLEDSSTSIPLLGDAIREQQRTGIREFNRAAYNRVLEPLGLQYTKDAPVGNDGIAKLGELVSKAYEHAFDGAKIVDDAPLQDGISQAVDDASNVLPGDRVRLLRQNVNRLITSKFDENGELSGDALKTAKNWLAEQVRSGPMASMDERNLASAYGDILGAVKDAIADSDPDRGALLHAADNAYMRFVRVAQAGATNNASGKEGIFTPNQLSSAIRSLEGSTRRMNFAKGTAPMQDLAQAGQQALSSTVPDSGTAIRTIFQHPLSALATSPAWVMGQGVYSNAGQRLAHALAFGAPAVRTAIAGYPARLAPAVLAAVGTEGDAARERLSGEPATPPQ